MAYSLAALATIICILFIVSMGCDNAFAQQGTALPPPAGKSPAVSTPLPPVLTWNKTYGGQGQDMAYAVIKIKDGYVIAGDMGTDVGLIKTDNNGNQIWRKTHGGDGSNNARSVIEVSDGYVAVGSSSSYAGFGIYDVYMLKTDLYGDMTWYKTFSYMRNGLMVNAYGRSAIATKDGYVIVGDANADINRGPDIYLLKTDLNGTLIWNRTFGGDAAEHGYAIVPISEGYIIAGDTCSYGNSLTSGVEASDIYLVKTDADGNPVWNKTFGGKYEDYASAIVAVDDGYVIVGSTKSHSDLRDYDVYLVKTDLKGNLVWEKHYGEADDDLGKGVVSTGDGYVIVGYTSSVGNFYKDVYIFKVDLDGNEVWSRTYGGADMDEGNAIVQNGDGFAIAGYSCTYGIYSADFSLLKIDPEVGPTPKPTATAEPQEPTAEPISQEWTLGTIDMIIIVLVTVGLVTVVGIAIAILYLLPKK